MARQPIIPPPVPTLDPAIGGSGLRSGNQVPPPPNHMAPGHPEGPVAVRTIGNDLQPLVRDDVSAAGWKSIVDKLTAGGAEVAQAVLDGYKIVYDTGFALGERFGYNFGFKNGGGQVSNQLLAPGRGLRALKHGIRRGNEVGRPETPLEAHTQDSLTADIHAIMHEYAMLPTAQKVRALLDAARSLPGVNIDNLAIEQDA